MPPIRRRLRAAAFVLSGLASAGAPALAQNETSDTIGPPQLKDFSLPGQRTTPPATPAPAPAARPPVAAPSTPAPAPPVTAAPVISGRPAPAPRREAPRETPPPRPDTGPGAATPAPPLPQPKAESPPPAETSPAPAPVPEASPAPVVAEPKGPDWLWTAAVGALLAALAAFFLLRRRRRTVAERGRDTARDDLGGALFAAPEAGAQPETRREPLPEPQPEPSPAPIPEPPSAPRPWIELDIVPERAAATEHEVYVRYALTLTNKGEAAARNIRIDPRLFNAGAEAEMQAFFQGPIHEQSGSPQILLQPGGSLKLNGQVALANADLREIELAGKRIFVPMVAINVAYDWADGGAGRTSRSWLVGREAEVPTEKMGPFRLDLGPRIYRSVGRREARLVMV